MRWRWCRGSTLTYAQLDAAPISSPIICAVFALAAEVVVGLCVERSPAMVIAVLAILKAGGAYRR